MAVILPATVLTSHLEACAAELATFPPGGDAAEDLAQIVGQLVSGQRHLAAALERLAATQTGPRAEVLRAASRASRHAADALAEGEQLFE